MPPSLREMNEHSVGGFEIVATDGSHRRVEVLDKLIFFPPEAPSLLAIDDEDEEYVDYDESVEVSENILDSLLFNCVGFGPCAPTLPPRRQGILKKPGERGPSLTDRNVSFSSLDIVEFGITLGNHPNSCSGPPVRLDWDTKKGERVLSLEEYEQTRSPRRKRRQLRYSYRHRKGVLQGEQGFTEEEVNEAWSEAIKIQQQRQETLKRGLLMMAVDDLWESTQRKFKRIAENVGMV